MRSWQPRRTRANDGSASQYGESPNLVRTGDRQGVRGEFARRPFDKLLLVSRYSQLGFLSDLTIEETGERFYVALNRDTRLAPLATVLV